MLEIGPLFAAALGYLLLLFFIAYATERGLIPARVSRHPLLPAPAAEIDAFRRYLRRILEDLPLGVCALGPDRDVVIWNRALEAQAGILANEASGGTLTQLDHPLARALAQFALRPETRQLLRLLLQGRVRFFSLSKSTVDGAALPRRGSSPAEGLVILVEDVSEQRALAAQVAHQDRLASIGRLAAGIAQEIGNPLTGIACIAQNLVQEEDPSLARDRVRAILEQARRIDGIVCGLLSFSRAGSGNQEEVETFSVREAVGEAIALVQLDRAAKKIPCQNNCPAELAIEGDRQRLSQVFVNLLSNAFDASRPGDRVWVDAKAHGGFVRILVIDQGAGIPESVRQRIFEPFTTTKEPGRGTRLGLPLAYSIVREHGGTMEVNSQVGAGTTILLQLPLQQKTALLARPEVLRQEVRA